MTISRAFRLLESLVKAPAAEGLHIRTLTQFEKEWVASEVRKPTFDVERLWFGLFLSVKTPQLPLLVNSDLDAFEAGLRADGFNIHRAG